MKTTSIPIFAGQGSLSIFSPKARTVATKDASTASGSLLLKAAHHAFTAELSSLTDEERAVIGIDLADFPSPGSLLEPKEKYQSSCIIQGTSLTLFQLLRYLSYIETTPGVSLETAAASFSEVAGFCSGSLAAAVVASSHTTVDFLSNTVEAFKLAVWIGYETELYRISERQEGEKELLSWGLVVFGWTREVALERIAAFNKTVSRPPPPPSPSSHSISLASSPKASSWEVFLSLLLDLVAHILQYGNYQSTGPLHLTAVSSEKVVSISGRGDILARFQIEEVAGKFSTRFTNVHTLYHGGSVMQPVKERVQSHLIRRNLKFPTLAETKIPLRSTVNGKLLSPATSSKSLLELVLDMILIECVNWDKAVDGMVSNAIRVANDTQTSFVNFGPGTGSVFQAQRPPHQNINLIDLSHTSDAAATFASQKPLRFKPEDGIAIVGMGVNMPGATDVSGLWRVLEEGLNTVSEIPFSRFDVSNYYDTSSGTKPVRSMGTKFGNFLKNPAAFDNTFFNISPREAKSLDPQQRVLLQTAYTAIENAGYVADSTDTFARESFGCYVGVATGDYSENLRDDIDVYYSTGNLKAFLSGRISYALKLSGPSLVVDTACSSSLIAIYQACRALEAGDCNAAVAGGVNVITSPDMYLGLDRAHFLSPTGQCKAFDESADGYCRSEGCGMFVLKRLSDAIAENDQILGVIRGVQVNQSGETHSITHPHAATQQVLFKRLLKETGVDPLDISVIEAHGTGTQAGDPAELASLRGTFAQTRTPDKPLHITSVKANIGHCEAASGAAGLSKLLLMLKHRTIPKQISLKKLNPKIAPLGTDGVEIARSNLPWVSHREGARRLALLNNFGAAGSNGVLLLEEAPELIEKPAELTRAAHLFALTAKNKKALENLRHKYIKYLRENKDTLCLEDVCYTATARRQPFAHRIAVTASSFDALISELEKAVPKQIPARTEESKTVFVFSGQGSQYLGMGRSLMQTSPVFREIVLQAHSSLVGLGFVGVLPIMEAADGVEPDLTPKQRVEAFQCTIFVLEYALAKLWISFGLQPDAVLGHSLGEYAALAISEVITFSDGLKMVANRARMMANLCKPSASGMLAVNAPPEKIEELLKSRPDLSNLTIACRNSTADCVVAGDLQQVDILRAHLKDNSIAKCIKLDVPYGYHSSAMDPILEPLTALAGSVKFSAPRIITGSNVLGKIIGSSDINAEYFAKHARHTVHFAEEIQEITSLPEFSGNVRYIEIGPHPISLPMVRSTLGSTASNAEFIPSMHKTKDPWVSLSDSLAGLFLSGFPAKWREVYAGSLAICVDIPSYPFEDKEFWVDYKEHNKATEVKDIAPEPSTGMATGYAMLASCVQLPGDGVDGIFETPISQLASSIMGHQVGGAALCPASIYHELAMSSAAFGVHSTTAALHTLSKIKYSHPLVYEDGSKKIVRVTLKLDSLTGDSSFTVSSYTDNPNSSQLHCAGELKQIPKASIEHKFNHRGLKLERTKISIFTSNGRQGPETIHTRMLYETIFPRVVSYSKPYQTIKSMTIDQTGTEGYAIVQIPTGYKSGKHVVNPVFMDTLLHAAGFIANSSVTAEEACICNETGQARILYDEIDYDDTFGVFCSVVYLAKESTFIADAYAANSAGKIIGGLKGMQFKKVNLAKFRKHLAHTLGKKAPTPQAAKTISTPVIQHVAPQAAPQAVAVAPAVDVVGQVARVIAEVCGVSLDNVTSGTEMEALGVDSLMIFEIADKLKATFSQITIDSSELAACHTVKDLEDAISKHMPAQSAAPPPSAPPPAPAPKAAPALIDTPPPSPPSGPALLDIKGFLESILGVSASDMQPDTDLESLGLDSLTSIEVLHSLKQSIGIDISPDTMNECKTIYDFESLVTKSMPRPSAPAPKDVSPAKDDTTELKKMLQMTSNPVSLQTRAGSGAPLFLVHDGSGMCNYYQRLSPLERNTWGFYNPRFFEMEQWSGGLADMASAYAKDIQETSPGPYILGGWSYGGVVAFEAARQLLRSGKPVTGVVLIDSPPPVNHQGLPAEVIAAVSRRSSGGNASRQKIESLIRTQFENNTRNLVNYRPASSGPNPKMVLLRSREGFSTAGLNCAPHEWLSNRSDVTLATGGWESLVGAKIPVIDIPGNHFEPFDQNNVAAVSESINKACRMLGA